MVPLNNSNLEVRRRENGRSKRRDRIEVIYDILKVTTRNASKTKIVRKVNLNFALSDRYINHLLKQGLVDRSLDKRGFVQYFTTDKGNHVLILLGELDKELFGAFKLAQSFNLDE